MNTELATFGDDLEAMMGIIPASTDQSSTPSITRVTQIHKAIMGMQDVGGKQIKAEILPVGTYQITQGDEVVYAQQITIRIMAVRMQWSRWNNNTEQMEKSIMAPSLKGDLKDNIGSYNLGRPSGGYVEDYDSLSDAMKEHMKSVKRVKVLMGHLSVDSPVDEEGNSVSTTIQDIPFIMDVKNRDSLKSIDSVLARKRPIEVLTQEINLTGDIQSIPNGPDYGVIVASPGPKVDIQPTDKDNIQNFSDYIDYVNNMILEKYNENCEDNSIEGEVF
jgi:hypothetical protein